MQKGVFGVTHLFLERKIMILFTDLDNTIIYSYRRNIKSAKRCVEVYKEREFSFISDSTFEMLKILQEKALIIPVTTRTQEQYERINLGVGKFEYALVCNGGVLLVDGEKDENWYNESLNLVKKSCADIQKAFDFLEKDERRYFELRYVENLFLFTKCEYAQSVVNDLKNIINSELADIFGINDKIYVIPKELSKGRAVKRLKKRVGEDYVVAAGDSEFDISLVNEADKGIVPEGFKRVYGINNDNIAQMSGKGVFSDELLSACLKIAENRKR